MPKTSTLQVTLTLTKDDVNLLIAACEPLMESRYEYVADAADAMYRRLTSVKYTRSQSRPARSTRK